MYAHAHFWSDCQGNVNWTCAIAQLHCMAHRLDCAHVRGPHKLVIGSLSRAPLSDFHLSWKTCSVRHLWIEKLVSLSDRASFAVFQLEPSLCRPAASLHTLHAHLEGPVSSLCRRSFRLWALILLTMARGYQWLLNRKFYFASVKFSAEQMNRS